MMGGPPGGPMMWAPPYGWVQVGSYTMGGPPGGPMMGGPPGGPMMWAPPVWLGAGGTELIREINMSSGVKDFVSIHNLVFFGHILIPMSLWLDFYKISI